MAANSSTASVIGTFVLVIAIDGGSLAISGSGIAFGRETSINGSAIANWFSLTTVAIGKIGKNATRAYICICIQQRQNEIK